MTRSPFDDPDLLERLLRGQVEPTLEPAGEEQLDAQELLEAHAFLARCRSALTAPERAPERARSADELMRRVLAQTTGEDLSWRGDLRLVGGFVRARLVKSPALRMVAALLLLQLMLVPGVLAYLTLIRSVEPEPDLYLDFQPYVAAPALEPVEPEADLLLGQEAAQALGRGLEGLRFSPDPDNARQWDRFHMSSFWVHSQGEPQNALERALRAREDLASSEDEAFIGTGPEALALAALGLEDALDRQVRQLGELGEAALALRRTRLLDGLQARLSDAASESGSLGADELLAGAALARAEGHGQLDERGLRLLEALRERSSHGLLGPGLRPGGPIGSTWSLALAAVLDELGVHGELCAAWR